MTRGAADARRGSASRTPEDRPPLAPGRVHLWRLSLALSSAEEEDQRSLLSPDEVARAERYAFARPRRDFIACRAALRLLLSRYTGLDPRALVFERNQFDKPFLAGGPAGLPRPDFNVSHSGLWGLIAVTLGARLGVDIERKRPIKDMDIVASTWFASAELASYRDQPNAAKRTAFFNGWTRKEAFIKALGKGLSHPLKSFDVSLGLTARLLRAEGEDVSRWSLLDLQPAPGYAGALAVDVPNVHLSCFEWPLEASDFST